MSEGEPKSAPPVPSLWTASQRRAIRLLLILILSGLAIQTIRRRVYVPENRSAASAEPGNLSQPIEGIDPNQADWQTLASIPSLGEKRAKLIVAYRDQYVATHGDGALAYRAPTDLSHVKGIAAATISNMQPFLIFPSADGSHRPVPAR